MAATYKGFNTIDQYKKFRLTDIDLVKRDILNSLMIKQGEVPGRPTVGTIIWSIIFEPMAIEIEKAIVREITRVINQDPRVRIEEIIPFARENGVQVEISIRILPTTEKQRMAIFFDELLNTAILL